MGVTRTVIAGNRITVIEEPDEPDLAATVAQLDETVALLAAELLGGA